MGEEESPLFDRVVEEIYTVLPLTLRNFVKDQSICEQWNEGSEYMASPLCLSLQRWGSGRKEEASCCPLHHCILENSKMLERLIFTRPVLKFLTSGLGSRGGLVSLAQALLRKAAGGRCTSCPLKNGQETSSVELYMEQ